MTWCVLERTPLPLGPLSEGLPKGANTFLPRRASDEQEALAIAKSLLYRGPGITILGPNDIRWDRAEIVRRLESVNTV